MRRRSFVMALALLAPLTVGLACDPTILFASPQETPAKGANGQQDANAQDPASVELKQLATHVGPEGGFVVLVGLPDDDPQRVMRLAEGNRWMIYVRSDQPDAIRGLRELAESKGLLGDRIFAEIGSPETLPLTPNLADAVWVAPRHAGQVVEKELLRVLRPKGLAMVGEKRLTKPVPEGIDDWSHPYHGPDNNPQSEDQLVRGNFETQFIMDPKFSPMPEQSVIAGGRIFKAMGHIAHKANQNDMLNTLLCINAYNGTVLWRRPLPEGFMIHRNTMVATDDALYLGDHEACHVYDAKTGEEVKRLTFPEEISDGPVWKWMAIRDGVLYGLVGNLEVKVETLRSDRPGLGHWPWGMWDGHDYRDPRTAFGHGRTLVALDPQTGKLLWHYRDEDFLDARGTCMRGERIYAYSPGKYMICVDATTGERVWKNDSADVLGAIGPHEKAQHYITGYATACYIKCSDDLLLFAGPQRARTVALSAKDGSLAWTHPVGNLQMVLRGDAIYAAGPEKTQGVTLDYKTGDVLSSFIARRACTRATGCVDSIFFRATGGTVRIMTEDRQSRHIAPMRPPCQDGVLISNGHLYWGPWMCGCQLSLYGNIGLRPVEEEAEQMPSQAEIEAASLRVASGADRVEPLGTRDADWVAFRGSASRSDTSPVEISGEVTRRWSVVAATEGELPTAPVTAGGYIFTGDRAGVLRAIDEDGKLVWKGYTAGPIYYPPAIASDRLYVGSADGFVYALEAKTGRELWRFRVARQDRRIPLFGKLVSRQPVAGGVVVKDGVVYAAAGITHYDGTVVVALDAITGKLRGINATSGKLSEVVDSGISMQGELAIVDGELRFPGGGVYEVARYDLADLKCLNEPRHQLHSEYRTAFYPWYPGYDRFVSMEKVLPDKTILCFDANYDGSEFGSLTRELPRADGEPGRVKKDLAGEFLRRRGKEPTPRAVWTDPVRHRFTSFAVCGNVLLATGHTSEDQAANRLMAFAIEDGKTLWQHDLPAQVTKGGIAVDASGNIYLTLEDGQLICFAGG
jgi:outer membrane protein assembly factor BamB